MNAAPAPDDAGIAAAWWRGLTPPAVATVSAWATTFRVWAGRTTAAAGRYALDRVPYLREPMDVLSEGSGIQRVVVMKAARLGFTEGLVMNLIGYAMHQAPGPILLVVPTRDVAVRLARESLDPMLQATPELAVRLGRMRGRGELRHATLHKEFPRGSLTLVGARSASALRQTSARYLLIDELDGCPRDLDGEGSPVGIAEARARTYGLQRKVLLISSPTERGRSLIESEYLATDQRHYVVPCVHCGDRQRLVVDQLTWTSGQPETATYTCAACRGMLVEGDKPRLLAGGAWVATARGRPRVRGYHVSALYSPSEWCTWADVAAAAEAAAVDPARDRVYRNTMLGEAIVERHEVPDWERLRARQTRAPLGVVPDGALFLTAGIDVQRDRLEFHLWGWGRDRRRWLVDVRVCEGDIETDAPWTALRALIDRAWPTADGAHGVPVTRAALDTRFRPARCQAFARTCPPGRVDLVEGMARLAGGALVGHYRQAEASERPGRRYRRRTGLRVWPINTGALKAELYGCLNLTEPGCAGWVALPAIGDEFLKQLVAEALVRKRTRGREVECWEKVYRDNHALDCAAYARLAAFRVTNHDQFTDADWRALEAPRGLVPPPPLPAAPTGTPETPAPAVVPVAGPAPAAAAVRWRRSSYWDRWPRPGRG